MWEMYCLHIRFVYLKQDYTDCLAATWLLTVSNKQNGHDVDERCFHNVITHKHYPTQSTPWMDPTNDQPPSSHTSAMKLIALLSFPDVFHELTNKPVNSPMTFHSSFTAHITSFLSFTALALSVGWHAKIQSNHHQQQTNTQNIYRSNVWTNCVRALCLLL